MLINVQGMWIVVVLKGYVCCLSCLGGERGRREVVNKRTKKQKNEVCSRYMCGWHTLGQFKIGFNVNLQMKMEEKYVKVNIFFKFRLKKNYWKKG